MKCKLLKMVIVGAAALLNTYASNASIETNRIENYLNGFVYYQHSNISDSKITAVKSEDDTTWPYHVKIKIKDVLGNELLGQFSSNESELKETKNFTVDLLKKNISSTIYTQNSNAKSKIGLRYSANLSEVKAILGEKSFTYTEMTRCNLPSISFNASLNNTMTSVEIYSEQKTTTGIVLKPNFSEIKFCKT